MATQFCFCAVDVSITGSPDPIPASRASSWISESISESVSNQQTTAVATSGTRFCRVTSTVNVHVAFGANPNASTGTGTRMLLVAGQSEYVAVNVGDKGAVVTA